MFASPEAVDAIRLADAVDTSPAAVRLAVESLNDTYEETSRSFRIRETARGYRFMTLPSYDEVVRRLLELEIRRKRLTPAVRETLAIVAYRQPTLRSDVEAVRGVDSGNALRTLLDEKLVHVAGRADLPGRPMLYKTTERFLDLLGLATIEQLPEA